MRDPKFAASLAEGIATGQPPSPYAWTALQLDGSSSWEPTVVPGGVRGPSVLAPYLAATSVDAGHRGDDARPWLVGGARAAAAKE